MQLAIASQEGIFFVLRWIHFFAGVTWIGLLYYFNFIQGEFFKEIEPAVKGVAVQKLVPRALLWFRWAAMWTFISGWSLLIGTVHTGVPLASSWGIWILTGATLGTFMWANVWFVIWPNQKKVIAGAPDAAAAGAKALLASRTNVLFSIPMLFLMGAARHLTLARDFAAVNFTIVIGVIGAVILLLEVNALKGKLGPLTTVKGVVHCGVALAAVLYLLIEITTRTM
ncbi:urate hydroxylase PuuD [bacterium]|nr:urate hydroxylase PuuD [bacterium]